MAVVRKMRLQTLEHSAAYSEVYCTYSIIHDDDGSKYLQVDTYG